MSPPSRDAAATLTASSRAFARHAHSGPPETRDLHHLRDLHDLFVQTSAAAVDSEGTARVIAYQRRMLRTVEQGRARWPDAPVDAVAAVMRRARLVARLVVGPQAPVTRRPRLLQSQVANLVDARDALVRSGRSDAASATALGRLIDRFDRLADDGSEARARASRSELATALVAELEAALDAHARLPAGASVRLSMAADRVLEGWRQIRASGVPCMLASEVVAVSRALAVGESHRRRWESPPEVAIAWIEPRSPDVPGSGDAGDDGPG